MDNEEFRIRRVNNREIFGVIIIEICIEFRGLEVLRLRILFDREFF